MIDFKSVKKEFSGANSHEIAFPDIKVEKGQHLAITGESGSGKTTLLNLIAGLITPSSGTISVNGQIISSLSESERDQFRGAHVGYIFQTFNLISGFSALENVLLGMVFGSRNANREKAEHLLERVGLNDRMKNQPRELSTGQQQRVAIARALINDPEIILADEPTGNLNHKTTEGILKLLDDICTGKTLLTVTHEPEVANTFEHKLHLSA
jgi:putative ABC transport system ATP-binding protein